jgi:hypothetical protein
MFFSSQGGELKGIEKESCGSERKHLKKCHADAKFRTKQFG